jgi:hypothetical protein
MTQLGDNNGYPAVADGPLPISPEMAAAGLEWYKGIWGMSDTGGNGPMFLFGKFPGGAEAHYAPQIPRSKTLDYRSIMVTNEGQFADGLFESRLPSFVFASNMSPELEEALGDRQHDTNVTLQYPDPQRSGHSVISHKMWCSNALIGKTSAPRNFLMDLNFTLPDDVADQFLHNMTVESEFLESLVRASHFGSLMRPGGDVQRFQNTRHKILNIPRTVDGRPNPDAALARRTMEEGPNRRMTELARWVASEDCPTYTVPPFGEVA